MIGDKVRDKDAVSAVAMICEMAAVAKNNGQTLFNKLIELVCTKWILQRGSYFYNKERNEWVQGNCRYDARDTGAIPRWKLPEARL